MTESTLHATNAYLRTFERALIDAGLGVYDTQGLDPAETPRQFQNAQDALKCAYRTGLVGRVPEADAALLNALAAELDV